MIFRRKSQGVFYPLALSAMTALLFTGCSSNSDSPENKLTGAPISGVLQDSDGTTKIDGATVNLDFAAKAAYISSDITKGGGIYSLKTPKGGTDKFKLVIDRDGYLTQFQDVERGKAVPAIVMAKAEPAVNIPSDGILPPNESGSATKPKVTFDSPDDKVSLTILKGAEIPSSLPKEAGKTLLPVGALAMGISPSSQTALKAVATVSLKVPAGLDNSGRKFPVYFLNSGKWEKQATSAVLSDAEVSFDIQNVGTYMVMTALADVTNSAPASSESVSSPTPIALGATSTKKVTNTIDIDTSGASTADKLAIEALIKSLLEKQYGIFGQEQTATIFATKQSSEQLSGKFVCNLIMITQTIHFIFNFGTINIPVTITINIPSITCGNDSSTGATGGLGGI